MSADHEGTSAQESLNAQLSRAAHFGEEENVAAALAAGADLESRTDDAFGYTPLIRAAKMNKVAVVRLLIERGAAVNARCSSGWYPTHWAATAGRLDALRVLVECRADVNVRTSEGWTALSIAEQKGKKDVVAYLQSLGAC
jgi:ankyrin repeat protein